jgi:hypothetical protein
MTVELIDDIEIPDPVLVAVDGPYLSRTSGRVLQLASEQTIGQRVTHTRVEDQGSQR